MKSLKTCTSRNAKRENHFICFSHYSLRARSVLFLGWIDFDLLVQWYVVTRQRKVYVQLKIHKSKLLVHKALRKLEEWKWINNNYFQTFQDH